MRPKNYSERRKRILGFAGLYAASLLLFIFIFSAFGFHLSADEPRPAVTPSEPMHVISSNNEIIQADSLLHVRLFGLEQADNKYTLLLSEKDSILQRNNAALAVSMNEASFKKALDSIDRAAEIYTGTEKESLYKTMLNSFKAIVNNRKAVKDIQASIASGKTSLPDNYQDMLATRNELAQKDNDLARLTAEIKELKGKSVAPSGAAGNDEAQKGETELLKTAFNDQQKEYNEIKEKYERLKSDNSNLATQIVEYKKAAQSQTESSANASNAKIGNLEQKIQDLNADLYFTKIDCNLSRVDAQQLISNARQRKELLTESLTMLNTLAASSDAGIQKKAKEKIVRLNHIATTLHD